MTTLACSPNRGGATSTRSMSLPPSHLASLEADDFIRAAQVSGLAPGAQIRAVREAAVCHSGPGQTSCRSWALYGFRRRIANPGIHHHGATGDRRPHP